MIYFKYKDMDSRNMGITVNRLPERNSPAEDKELITIPGRNGYLTKSRKTYLPIELQIECTLKPYANIDSVTSWLKGSGRLIVSKDLERYYDATVINSIPIERVIGLWKKFIVQFQCQPFYKSINDTTNKLNLGENVVVTQCTAPIFPILEIQGDGSYQININNQIIGVKDLENKIVIDNDLMNATNGNINMNDKMVGKFFSLNPGTNSVTLTKLSGNFISSKIIYKEAWI